jgi:hypothetical protein
VSFVESICPEAKRADETSIAGIRGRLFTAGNFHRLRRNSEIDGETLAFMITLHRLSVSSSKGTYVANREVFSELSTCPLENSWQLMLHENTRRVV